MFFKNFKNYHQYNALPAGETLLGIAAFEVQSKPNEVNVVSYVDNSVLSNSPLNFKKNFTNINDFQIF